ncbi:zinc-dependent metalloprotease [Mongoliitalea daihaiensis]|uniref:zinc-dependent metalloprotease n=1 Tax=Mongoliitalea daihaiensis TaxID=2782006 RepID=UPI001F19298F|nr:zinc-dependent metalloprotease [Mongoliitalea daihaiensis]UJP64615.1 zinc-dependent metalloprotease [Mongoliitalea daihaiensis]
MRKIYALLLSLSCLLGMDSQAQSIDLSKLEKKEGYINFYLDESKGKIYLEIDRLDDEFLYVNSMPAGVGSNDIGLDRGQLGRTRIVEFRKAGNKILLFHKNYDFRAYSENPAEVKSVKDAFAESVLWGFDITQESNGKILVDATSFYLQDAHQVAEKLGSARQGTYRLDNSRSAIYSDMTKNFPKNTEVEAIITVTGTPTGGYIRSVTPSPEAVTVRQRHSFIELPDDGYQPREFDPRSGYFHISYMDFTSPIGDMMNKKFISRHRLEKKDPTAAVSEPIKPIVYYLDRGTPEPVRTALLEGGNWWAEAFEAAGFKNAYRVELAPEGMDPMDVRYNVIQWVHRSTRGWSYGSSVRDPRTGEIIKGHVTLGSLRVRQDYLIAQGLLQPFEDGQPKNPAMLEMALARLRQLSAHEIGHTIGLAHAYASSPTNRASVMDYPYPMIQQKEDGSIDLSNAYDDKIGDWDKWAIRYGYETVPSGQTEQAHLKKLLEDTYAAGHTFISDTDSRHPSGSHPTAHLWDNGESASNELVRLLRIRNKQLETFGLNAIEEGQPEALMEEVMVPLFLMHRYQVEATSKLLGGLDYTYKIKGDNQRIQSRLDATMQNRALSSLLLTITPENLMVPTHILDRIPPRPMGYGRNRETFPSRNGLNFDPLAPAENIVDMVFSFLFEVGRANRLHQQAMMDNSLPSFASVLGKTMEQVFDNSFSEDYRGEIKVMTENKLIDHLIALANHPQATVSVRATVRNQLKNLVRNNNLGSENIYRTMFRNRQLSTQTPRQVIDQYLADKILNYLELPEKLSIPAELSIPDGAPIGTDEIFCDFEF